MRQVDRQTSLLKLDNDLGIVSVEQHSRQARMERGHARRDANSYPLFRLTLLPRHRTHSRVSDARWNLQKQILAARSFPLMPVGLRDASFLVFPTWLSMDTR